MHYIHLHFVTSENIIEDIFVFDDYKVTSSYAIGLNCKLYDFKIVNKLV